MDPSPSLWDAIVRRASALRHRYRHLPQGPASTWSLVNRAAQRFGDGALPRTGDPHHQLAQWQLAMTSVLRDLHRRHAAARRRGAAPALPLDPAREPAAAAPDDAEERALLAAALDELARQDRRAARVLALRHAAGLTWAEIASAAGTSVTTVRRDAAFALAWLRRELRRQGLPIPQEHRER